MESELFVNKPNVNNIHIEKLSFETNIKTIRKDLKQVFENYFYYKKIISVTKEPNITPTYKLQLNSTSNFQNHIENKVIEGIDNRLYAEQHIELIFKAVNELGDSRKRSIIIDKYIHKKQTYVVAIDLGIADSTYFKMLKDCEIELHQILVGWEYIKI